MAKRMATVSTFGQMELLTKANGRRTKSPDTGIISGRTDDDISDTGEGTLWMTLASILGKTAECMKDSTEMTRSTGLECTLGVTRNDMQAGGVMVSSTVSEYLSQKKASVNSECGKMEES